MGKALLPLEIVSDLGLFDGFVRHQLLADTELAIFDDVNKVVMGSLPKQCLPFGGMIKVGYQLQHFLFQELAEKRQAS
jgi:hypothetical protein